MDTRYLHQSILVNELREELEAWLQVDCFDRLPIHTQKHLLPLFLDCGIETRMADFQHSFAHRLKEHIYRGSEHAASSKDKRGTEAASSSEEANDMKTVAPNGLKESDLFLENFEREMLAYQRMRPDLLAVHEGRFVATCGGKVIDSDVDESSLEARVVSEHKDVFVLIKQVVSTPDDKMLIDTLGM